MKKCAKNCIYLPEYLRNLRNIYSFATAKKIKIFNLLTKKLKLCLKFKKE